MSIFLMKPKVDFAFKEKEILTIYLSVVFRLVY